MNGRLENEIKYNNTIDNMLINMPNFIKNWHNSLKADGYTGATRFEYVDRIKRYLKTINSNVSQITICDITKETINNFMISIQHTMSNGECKETSFSYKNNMYIAINSLCNYLNENGLSDTQFNLKRPIKRNNSSKKKKEILDEEDFHKIIVAANNNNIEFYRRRDLAILSIFMNTGIRKSGLQSINVNDIDYENAILYVIDKGDKEHKYKLNPKTMEIIYEWLEYRTRFMELQKDDGALFITKKYSRISTDSITDLVLKYTKEALGKGLRPHQLRAGYCSILYEKTRDIEFVRKAVGHSRLETTQRYIVLDEDHEREKASEIMASIF